MANKTTTPVLNSFTQIAQKIHDHVLRGNPERVIEMIYDVRSNFYSFALTETTRHGSSNCVAFEYTPQKITGLEMPS